MLALEGICSRHEASGDTAEELASTPAGGTTAASRVEMSSRDILQFDCRTLFSIHIIMQCLQRPEASDGKADIQIDPTAHWQDLPHIRCQECGFPVFTTTFIWGN